MLDTLLRPVTSVVQWAARRTTRGLICHVRESRRVGSEDAPGVFVTVVVENPQGENAFVGGFRLQMLDPFQADAVGYEYRDTPNTTIGHLSLNIPGHGISDPVIVIALFHEPLSYTSDCRARIAAVGRRGFRLRWQEFQCAALS